MDTNTARILIQANNRFYAQQALSFGKTRNNRWPGWERIAHLLESLPATACASQNNPLQVLDIAAGNLRFEAFLERALTCPLAFHAVDNAPFVACDGLSSPVQSHQLDVLEALLENQGLSLPFPTCSLTVSFGFMHHIPGQDMRCALLEELSQATTTDGLIAVSFWRFLDNPQLAKQAQTSWEPACISLAQYGLDPTRLDAGDAFLGWDGKPDVWRYCHSFSSGEIDQIIEAAGASLQVIDRFRADGRTHNLNEYVIFRKR